jgi:hypothetical protein
MKRLIFGILATFFAAALSAAVIFIISSLLMFQIAKMLLQENAEIGFSANLNAIFRAQGYAVVIFASVVTAVLAYITLQVIQRRQRLQLRDLLQVFKSFLWATIICMIFHQALFYLVVSGLEFELFSLLAANFFNVVLPLTWVLIAFYWIRTYRARFINDSEEWMLK